MFKSNIKKILLKTHTEYLTIHDRKRCLSSACSNNLDLMIHKFANKEINKEFYLNCYDLLLMNFDNLRVNSKDNINNLKALKAIIVCMIKYTDIPYEKILKKLEDKAITLNL